jgi:hypothetical protein
MKDPQPPFQTPQVAARFFDFSTSHRGVLLEVRHAIFGIASTLPETGRIEETLKWGQPSYLTPDTKSGTTLRLGVSKGGLPSLYAHCQTTLISDFKSIFPDDFAYDGNRAVHIDEMRRVPMEKLKLLIVRALIYHIPSDD